MKGIKSWFAKEHGTTAIEFAMLSVPFTMLLIGIVETTLFFATGVVMEGATADTARMIRTGQVQNSANPVQTFEDSLCDRVSLLIDCRTLQYEVLAVPNNSFINANGLTPTFDAGGDLVPAGFDPAESSDAVLVRVVYRYNFLTPFMSAILARDPASGLSTLMSTVVIRNEPYSFGG